MMMVLLIVNEQHQVSNILCNLIELTLTSRIGPTVMYATLSLNLEITLLAWLRITFICSFADVAFCIYLTHIGYLH